MVRMRGLLTIGVALGLGGCDVVLGLDREPYGVASVYSAYEAELDQDLIPDLVVLDRTPGADRIHVVFGDLGERFGERLVTIPLSFRPLAFAIVRLGGGEEPSVFVVGDRADGSGALALLRQRTAIMFDPPIEFSFAGRPGAISAVSPIHSRDGTFAFGVIAGGSALITRPSRSASRRSS